MRRSTGWIAATALATTILATTAVAQTPTVNRSPATAPELGRVIRGTSATVFSVSTGGAVTRTSGNAIRLSTGSVTAPTISVSCGLLNLNNICLARRIRVTVQITGATGEARIVRLRAGTVSNATVRSGAVMEGTTVTFEIEPLGLIRTATFPLGMDVSVDAGALPGPDSFTYSVTAVFI